MIQDKVVNDDKFSVTTFHVCLSINLICFANQIFELLIPEEEADLSDLVLEVTAGVGGQEAMLFTAEVRMR